MLDVAEPAAETRYRPYFVTPETDPVPYRVRCLPPEPSDWSLRQLGSPEGSSLYRFRLGEQLKRFRDEATVFYAPTVSHMSGVMLRKRDYMDHQPLGTSFPMLLRPTDKAEADGAWLDPGNGFLMSAGGCPPVILTTSNGNCGVAHAGLDSLVDPYVVHGKGNPHPNPSIIDTMVQDAKRAGALPSSMTLRAFYAIPWQAFPRSAMDPVYAVKNRRLLAYLCGAGFGDAIKYLDRHEHICLSTLIRLQAERHGIKTIEVGLELPLDGRFAYTSHGDSNLSDPCRNLVIVTRPPTE